MSMWLMNAPLWQVVNHIISQVPQSKTSGGFQLVKEAVKKIFKGPRKRAAKKVDTKASSSSSDGDFDQPGPSTSKPMEKNRHRIVMRDISSDTSSDDNYEPPKTSNSTFFKDKPGSKSSAKNKVQLQFENDTFFTV